MCYLSSRMEFDFWWTVHILQLSSRRRMGVRRYNDALDALLATRGWTDNSPVLGCVWDRIACDYCLAERHVENELGYNPYCPQLYDPDSTEDCLWGDPQYGGLCDACWLKLEFGCGWGMHICSQCVHSAHHSELIAMPCIHCAPCPNCADPHCVVVCPNTREIEIVG